MAGFWGTRYVRTQMFQADSRFPYFGPDLLWTWEPRGIMLFGHIYIERVGRNYLEHPSKVFQVQSQMGVMWSAEYYGGMSQICWCSFEAAKLSLDSAPTCSHADFMFWKLGGLTTSAGLDFCAASYGSYGGGPRCSSTTTCITSSWLIHNVNPESYILKPYTFSFTPQRHKPNFYPKTISHDFTSKP